MIVKMKREPPDTVGQIIMLAVYGRVPDGSSLEAAGPAAVLSAKGAPTLGNARGSREPAQVRQSGQSGLFLLKARVGIQGRGPAHSVSALHSVPSGP